MGVVVVVVVVRGRFGHEVRCRYAVLELITTSQDLLRGGTRRDQKECKRGRGLTSRYLLWQNVNTETVLRWYNGRDKLYLYGSRF